MKKRKDDTLDPYDILSKTTLFSKLDEDTLKSMISECEEIRFKKSETIDYKEGERDLFIILSGRLKVTHIDYHTGRSLALFLKSKGDIFDLFTLLDGKEHVIFPVVLDDMRALRISIDRAREWILEYRDFNVAFLPYLGEKMRELEEFGTGLVFHDTVTRLAKLILNHTHCDSEDGHFHPVKLINDLSHEALAELIGSVRQVVTLQISKLKEENIIMQKRGHLIVSDLKKLIHKCDR